MSGFYHVPRGRGRKLLAGLSVPTAPQRRNTGCSRPDVPSRTFRPYLQYNCVRNPITMKSGIASFCRQNTRGYFRLALGCATAAAIVWGGIASAANQSMQGPKKEEGGYDTDAPNAILIDADSGSVLFEKNGDQPT